MSFTQRSWWLACTMTSVLCVAQETKPAQEKPKPAETKAAEQKAATKPAEQKPESKPAEKKAEAAPAEQKPATPAAQPATTPAQAPAGTQAAPQGRAEPERRSPNAVPDKVTLKPEYVKGLNWRSIGPAAMGGRITALSVCPTDHSTYWVATSSAGLLKTTNNGLKFEHQFDKESTASVGDVCVAPSNPNIVWVGTGENNPRNSVTWGDGVYKSTDGGKTWKNMGLKKTFQIGKVIVHPTNPDIVYVGALGRLYGPNAERGLYKTTNGGETWTQILYIDDKTGVQDMRMHPTDPDTLLVAMWERKRDQFDTYLGDDWPLGMDSYDPQVRWGAGSGLYKTSDGGKTFRKITKGLPTCKIGRIGLDWYVKDPKVVYAIVDSEKIGGGTPPATPTDPTRIPNLGMFAQDVDDGIQIARVMEGGPAEQAGFRDGDFILSVNGTKYEVYEELTDWVQTQKVGDKVKVEIKRGEDKMTLELTLAPRPNIPGRPQQQQTPAQQRQAKERPWLGQLGGQNQNVQDKQGPNGHEYGGIFRSEDGGESWTRINSLNPRPMYFGQIRVDPSDSNHIYVLGVSMYRSTNGGKFFRPDAGRGVHADQHALWINPKDGRHLICGCDGGFYVSHDRSRSWDHLNTLAIGQFYHVCIDTKNPATVYGGLQDNGSWGGPITTLNGSGALNEDWISVGGGDGFVCRVDPNDPNVVYSESQGGMMSRRNLRTGEGGSIRPRRPAPQGEAGGRRGGGAGGAGGPGGGRGNVENPTAAAPGQAAPAGQQAAQPSRPRDYRFNWNTPFILSHHNSKILYTVGEYVFRSYNQGRTWKEISPEVTKSKIGSGTAVSESPLNPDILYAGTDDGGFWGTQDGGKTWNDLSKNVALPGPRWVATIEASRFVEGRVYVSFDGHRSNDDNPLIFVSEDFGKTFKSLVNNLPSGSTRVLREDIVNQDLLFVGTEFACYASVDRGQTWNKINNNLPTVAVHEFAFHHSTGEMVAATHGRSLWVLNVTPLRQTNARTFGTTETLFAAAPAVRFHSEPRRGGTNRRFEGTNAPSGGVISYHLPADAQRVSVKIMDVEGKVLRELQAPNKAGLNQVVWNMTQQQQGRGPGGFGGPGGGFGPGGAGGRLGRGPGGAGAEAGTQAAGTPAAGTPPVAAATGGPATAAQPPTTAQAQAGEPSRRGGRMRGAGGQGGQPGGPPGRRTGDITQGGQRPATPPAATGTGPATTAQQPAAPAGEQAAAAPQGQRGGGGGGRGGFGFGMSIVPVGTYKVVLTVDGRETSKTIKVEYTAIAAEAAAASDRERETREALGLGEEEPMVEEDEENHEID